MEVDKTIMDSKYPTLNYKLHHEEFMQNHNGTTSLETFALIIPCGFLVFLSTSLASFLLSNLMVRRNTKHFAIDFICVVMPTVLGMTVFHHYKFYYILVLVFLSLFLSVYLLLKRKGGIIRYKKQLQGNRRNFLTNVRVSTMLISIIAILAVDFRVFPRRFAKTETFGYSLMDVGVGLFVCSNGFVAPEIKKKPQSLLKNIISSIPLWILGIVRYLITSKIDYQTHVSEYGVHWNFFITLAVTKILSSIIFKLIDVDYSLTIALSLLTQHEFLLQHDLANWVFSANPRTSFLLANREGIVSSLGYVGLYFLSVHFGKMIYRSKNDYQLAKSLFFSSFMLISAVIFFESKFGISRRLANVAYCFWTLFLGVFMLFMFLCGENFSKYLYIVNGFKYRIYVPFIYEAISFNGLATFLLANIFTGLINCSIQTLNVDGFTSIIIIGLYIFVTCLIISILFIKNIKLKLW